MPRARPTTPRLETRGGVYYATWYDAAKRQRGGLSLHTRLADEATHRFAAFLLQGADFYRAAQAGLHGLAVETALDQYFNEHCLKKVVDTERQEDAIINLKQHFGGVAIKLIDDEMVSQYVAKRTSGEICGQDRRKVWAPRPAAASTVRRELVVLVAAIDRARKKKRLAIADVPSIDLPEGAPAKETWLTHEQLAALRAENLRRIAYLQSRADGSGSPEEATDYLRRKAVAEAVRDFTEIAYYTASRRDAIETLTTFQVDLKQDRIRLAKPGERKTKKRRPVIRIDPAIRPILERLLLAATERGKSPDEKIELTKTLVMGTARSLYRPFVAACVRAGIPDVSPHVLRHTRATHLLQAGVSIWDVAKLLGDSVQTVDRVYGHAAAGYQREITEEQEETA